MISMKFYFGTFLHPTLRMEVIDHLVFNTTDVISNETPCIEHLIVNFSGDFIQFLLQL